MGCCMSSTDQRALQSQNNGSNNAQGHSSQQNGNAPERNPHNQSERSQRAGEARGAGQSNRDRNGNANAGSGDQASAQIGRITYLQNPNVEKVLSTQIVGEGIKRTPAYETPLMKHDLDKWRKEFWETRTQGSSHIWQLLRNACEESQYQHIQKMNPQIMWKFEILYLNVSPETAEALILAAGLSMPQNSLTLVIDENGVYYRVPISCINEPINYNVNYQDQKLKAKAKPAEKVFHALKIRSAKVGDTVMATTNLVTVAEFKLAYLSKINDKELQTENIRMFCLGKELKDDLFLYSYDIVDEMVLQIMYKKQ